MLFDFGQLYDRTESTLLNNTVPTKSNQLIKKFPDGQEPNPKEFEETAENILNKQYVRPQQAHQKLAKKLAEHMRDIFDIAPDGKPLYVIEKELDEIENYYSQQKKTRQGRLWAAIEEHFGPRNEGGWTVDKKKNNHGKDYLIIVPIKPD